MITSERSCGVRKLGRVGFFRIGTFFIVALQGALFAEAREEVERFVESFDVSVDLSLARSAPEGADRRGDPALSLLDAQCPSIACRAPSASGHRARMFPNLEWEALSILRSWQEVEDTVEKWSVSEKYDLTVGDEGFSLSRALRGSDASPKRASEDRYNRAWAAASVVFDGIDREARLPARHPFDLVWTPRDIEELIVHQAMTSDFDVLRLAGHPHLDPMYFHAVLVHRLADAKKAFVIERSVGAKTEARLVTEYRTEIAAQPDQRFYFRTQLTAWSAFAGRETLNLEYVLQFDPAGEFATSGTWQTASPPQMVWIPAQSAKFSIAIEALAGDELGTRGHPEFVRWAGAASRQGKILCAVTSLLYSEATAKRDYPCESYSSTTP